MTILVVIFLTLGIIAIITVIKKCSSHNSKLQQFRSRPLGILERWYDTWHNIGYYRAFVMCANLKGKPFTNDELNKALVRLMNRHPLLACSINYSIHKSPHFIPIDDIENKFIVKKQLRLSDDTWKSVADEDMKLPFQMDSPLFRITVLSSEKKNSPWELILAVHHAICDGRAGANFLKELLEALEDVQNNKPLEDKITLLPPPVESIMDMSPSYSNIFFALRDQAFPFLKKKNEAWLYPERMEIVDAEKRTSSMIYFSIDPETVNLLRSKCRQFKTTITGALFSAASHALLDILKEDSKLITVLSPYDVRGLGKPPLPASTMGAFICPSEFHFLAEKKNDFWSDAANIRNYMDTHFEGGLASVGLLKLGVLFLESLVKGRMSNPPNGRFLTITFSNLGAYNFKKEYHNNNLENVWFTQIKLGEGATFHFSSISNEVGGMSIALNHLDDPIITEMSKLICPKIQKILIEKANE